MAFRGQHEHNLDAKDRVTVPAKYRAELAGGVVLMEGVEQCVELWPKAGAEAMEQAWIDPLSPMGADTRRLRRRIFGTSEEVELDSAGRVRVPKHLLRHAELDGPCLVIGVGDHLEIWSPSGWGAESETFEAQAEDLTERLAAGSAPAAGGAGASA